MTGKLPDDIARCEPSRPCPQQDTCARAQDSSESALVRIDGTAALSWRTKACWLYLDVRGLGLVAEIAEHGSQQ